MPTCILHCLIITCNNQVSIIGNQEVLFAVEKQPDLLIIKVNHFSQVPKDDRRTPYLN